MSYRGIIETTIANYEKQRLVQLYRTDPVAWAIDVVGEQLTSDQREFFYSVRDNYGTAVAAGHGVGKSYGAAILCAWWADMFWDDDCFIATTAPTFDQVNILWDNIRKVKSRIEVRFEQGLIDHKLPGYITSDNQWKLDNGDRIGQGRKPPDNKSDVAFQGRHAKHLFAIGDEAVGIPAGFLEALGNIATGELNRQLLLANPTDPTCLMAQKWKDKPEGWHLMHISVLNLPTMKEDPFFNAIDLTGMSGPRYVADKKAEWGEDDPRYIARVLGEWAFDSSNMVFTEEEIARAINTCVRPDPMALMRFGVDVARSAKGDATVVYRCQEGDVWFTDDETGEPTEPAGYRGEHIRKVDSWRGAPLTGSNPDNLGSDYRIDALANEWGANALIIDVAGGYGIGVKDGLVEIDNDQYIMIDAWGSDTSSVDRRMWTNARSFNYFELKRKAFAGIIDIDGSDAELVDELEGLQYEHDSAARVKIEAKDDMKKRGVKSPDHADAVWYAAMNIDHIFVPIKPGDVVSWDENEGLDDMAFYGELMEMGW